MIDGTLDHCKGSLIGKHGDSMRGYVLLANTDLPQPANESKERGKDAHARWQLNTQQPAAIITLLLKIIFPRMHAMPTD